MYDNLTGCRVVAVDHLSRMHTIHVIFTGLSSESQKVRAARNDTTEDTIGHSSSDHLTNHFAAVQIKESIHLDRNRLLCLGRVLTAKATGYAERVSVGGMSTLFLVVARTGGVNEQVYTSAETFFLSSSFFATASTTEPKTHSSPKHSLPPRPPVAILQSRSIRRLLLHQAEKKVELG